MPNMPALRNEKAAIAALAVLVTAFWLTGFASYSSGAENIRETVRL